MEDSITHTEIFLSISYGYKVVPVDVKDTYYLEASDFVEIPQHDKVLMYCAHMDDNEVMVLMQYDEVYFALHTYTVCDTLTPLHKIMLKSIMLLNLPIILSGNSF